MAFISNNDDKSLISRVENIIELSLTRHKPCFLGFLNERESYIVQNYFSYCSEYIHFFGGYDNAQRTYLCYSENSVSQEEYPIKAIYYQFRKVDKLSHRDLLGALIGLGIERSCIGDIIVCDGYAVCYVKEEIYDFVLNQLDKVGRAGVKVVDEKSCKITYMDNKEELFVTLTSLRLDVIVAALTGLSREKTKDIIMSQKVFTNYVENQNVSYKLNVCDILSTRGKGKYIIKESMGVTKKGRLKILVEHFR